MKGRAVIVIYAYCNSANSVEKSQRLLKIYKRRVSYQYSVKKLLNPLQANGLTGKGMNDPRFCGEYWACTFSSAGCRLRLLRSGYVGCVSRRIGSYRHHHQGFIAK